MTQDDFMRMTPREMRVFMPGTRSAARKLSVHSPVSARRALECVIAEQIGERPCYVLFSGGRDSSALLALATRIARRQGADDPVAVTSRHPHAPRSDESDWQDMVLSHLGLREHLIFEFKDEQSLLAPDAQQSLRRNGLLWPPDAHVQTAYFGRLKPGTVIAGQGGDLIISGRRITPLASALRGRHPRRALLALARAVAPRANHSARRMVATQAETIAPWLTASGRRLTAELLTEGHQEPLSWGRSVRSLVRPRSIQLGMRNLPATVRAHGHVAVMPYEDETFVAALAQEGKFWGLGDRTTIMRYLFNDLLPDAVLSRTTKAAFNEVRWGEREREFARTWTGDGVDDEYVDSTRLQQSWLSDEMLPLAALPLHAAWLAQNELPVVPS